MPTPTDIRIVAVEEHYATTQFWAQVADLAPHKGSEPEAEFMTAYVTNPTMRRRMSDLSTRLAEMDDTGVDVSLLSLNPPGVQLYADAARASDLARETNDALTGLVAANPTRIGALAAVAPQDPAGAAAEIRRTMTELSFNGVMIGSHTGGHYLDEPDYDPILTALEETDATLYLHPRMPSPQLLPAMHDYGLREAIWGFTAETALHAMRLMLSGALDRHPNLRIVLGHMGESLPYLLWRLDDCYAKNKAASGDLLGMVHLELTPSEYFLRNFSITTSGVCDPDVLDYCLKKLTADRILFAIDSPYEDSGQATGFLTGSGLDDAQLARIAHGNAERLFRVPPA